GSQLHGRVDPLVSGRDPIDLIGLWIGRARGMGGQHAAGEQKQQATRSWSGACSFKYPDAYPEHWLSHPLVRKGPSPAARSGRAGAGASGLGSPAQTVRMEILFLLNEPYRPEEAASSRGFPRSLLLLSRPVVPAPGPAPTPVPYPGQRGCCLPPARS